MSTDSLHELLSSETVHQLLSSETLHKLRWVSAIVGGALFLLGLLMAVASRRPSLGRNFGFFALQFGAGILMFYVAAYVSKYHSWSIAATLAGAVLLASAARKLFTLNRT